MQEQVSAFPLSQSPRPHPKNEQSLGYAATRSNELATGSFSEFWKVQMQVIKRKSVYVFTCHRDLLRRAKATFPTFRSRQESIAKPFLFLAAAGVCMWSKWLPVLRLERFIARAVRRQHLSFSFAITFLGKASQSSDSGTVRSGSTPVLALRILKYPSMMPHLAGL